MSVDILRGIPTRASTCPPARLEVVALLIIGMGQQPTVMILGLTSELQPYVTTTGAHQCLQATSGGLRERLGNSTLAAHFRRVQADQPDAPPVGQTQRVAIDDLGDFLSRERPIGRAKRLGLESEENRNEKGAHQGRLFPMLGESHRISVATTACYLAPNTPKRCLKRSIRPPVSSTFCLPV